MNFIPDQRQLKVLSQFQKYKVTERDLVIENIFATNKSQILGSKMAYFFQSCFFFCRHCISGASRDTSDIFHRSPLKK